MSLWLVCQAQCTRGQPIPHSKILQLKISVKCLYEYYEQQILEQSIPYYEELSYKASMIVGVHLSEIAIDSIKLWRK